MHESQELKMPLKMPFMKCHLKNALCIPELIYTIVVTNNITMGLWFKIIRIDAG